MMDSQLMGEFEGDVKELEADSWSATVDKKFLKLHKKDEVKRQDVIYGKVMMLQTEVCRYNMQDLQICFEKKTPHPSLPLLSPNPAYPQKVNKCNMRFLYTAEWDQLT